ncbi:unnamed protein product [Brassica rapa]|uniref:Uncharacterized protein n=1 Tax=Brassica campestris TaxID=3711 RepID=A0A3P5YTA4_BRACM|nr:unnamed protein product [Brassica rapa]VDC70982.1 unnamed protein product [Brassica rapa]
MLRQIQATPSSSSNQFGTTFCPVVQRLSKKEEPMNISQDKVYSNSREEDWSGGEIAQELLPDATRVNMRFLKREKPQFKPRGLWSQGVGNHWLSASSLTIYSQSQVKLE